MQPGSQPTQPSVDLRWCWAPAQLPGLGEGAEAGLGGGRATGGPSDHPASLPEVVLSSCPVHVKFTFLMMAVYESSENLHHGISESRDDGPGRGFCEQSVQSLSNSVPGSWR